MFPLGLLKENEFKVAPNVDAKFRTIGRVVGSDFGLAVIVTVGAGDGVAVTVTVGEGEGDGLVK
jgi:hypothetical protein